MPGTPLLSSEPTSQRICGDCVLTFTKLPEVGSALAKGTKVNAAQVISDAVSAVVLIPIPFRLNHCTGTRMKSNQDQTMPS
jgi:hypothetical protein